MSAQYPPMPDEGTAVAMALAPFHLAVVEYRERPEGVEVIRAMLPNITLLGLGSIGVPPGSPAYGDARQAQSNIGLIHFDADDREYLPLWSDPNALIVAGQMFPEWTSLQPLILSGNGIQDTLSPTAWIVINPWTDVELAIPPVAESRPGRV